MNMPGHLQFTRIQGRLLDAQHTAGCDLCPWRLTGDDHEQLHEQALQHERECPKATGSRT